MERRVREDEEVNSFGRPPIGEGKTEQASAYFLVISPSICAHSYGGLWLGGIAVIPMS